MKKKADELTIGEVATLLGVDRSVVDRWDEPGGPLEKARIVRRAGQTRRHFYRRKDVLAMQASLTDVSAWRDSLRAPRRRSAVRA